MAEVARRRRALAVIEGQKLWHVQLLTDNEEMRAEAPRFRAAFAQLTLLSEMLMADQGVVARFTPISGPQARGRKRAIEELQANPARTRETVEALCSKCHPLDEPSVADGKLRQRLLGLLAEEVKEHREAGDGREGVLSSGQLLRRAVS